jgi:PAS domain S-box-containing protein
MARGKRASTTRAKSGSKIKQVAALEESQEKFRKIFESVTDAISVIDLNGVITEVNQRTVEMHGFKSRGELLGKSALELVAPRDHERIAANMRRAITQGTVRGVEYTLLKADGSEFPGELSTSILKDASGKLIGHITIARHITERKQAEQALADEVTRRRILVDQSLDGIVVLDEDARVVEANKRFAEMLGYTSEEVRELHTWDWDKNFPPEKLLEMGRAVDEKGLHLETQHHRKDGAVIDVDISINGAVIAGQKLIFCVCRDITERKKADEALRESEEKYKTLSEDAPIGIYFSDFNGTLLYGNKKAEEIIGYKREELTGKNFLKLKLLDPKEIGKAMKLLVLNKLGKATGPDRFALNRKDGTKSIVEIRTRITTVGGKKVVLGMVEDITERKRMDEELKEAQEQLVRSEKLAVIGQLASGVGHELRNPLGAIKTGVQYARRKIAGSELAASEPKVVEFLGLVDEEVDRANKVITDLLSFSRVAKPAVSLVNAGSIIRDALNHVAVPENVEVVADVDPGVPLVMVDAGQIQQVFVNVILNALEAMPEGGRLEIRARGRDRLVTVEFTDTGSGIPESMLGKIFEPLFTTKAKGIGLGLAMSKNIMERHGGDIGVRSNEGKGTTFTLSLPTRVV